MSQLFIKLTDISMTYLKEYLGDSLFELHIKDSEPIYLSHCFRQEGSRVCCLIYKNYVATFCKSIYDNNTIFSAEPICFTVIKSEDVGGLKGQQHMMPRFKSKEIYSTKYLYNLLIHEIKTIFKIHINITDMKGLFISSNFDCPNYMGDINHFMTEYHEDVY
jgi:hypothetical protein